MALTTEVKQFLEQMEEVRLRMGLEQFLNLKIMWCEAADEMHPRTEMAVPLMETEDDGAVSMAWVYPAERLVIEVSTKGWVTWQYTKLTGHTAIWGCIESGQGIPDTRIRGLVKRRAKAFGC